jgi:CubicO group peptidase (beta-lactamase class C family)
MPNPSTPIQPLRLYAGEPQHDVFPHTKDIYPSSEMAASRSPFSFPDAEPVELVDAYVFEGKKRSSEEFLKETDTSALLVLKDGSVCYERYLLTGGRDVHWMSFSVAKSFLSALIGIAIEESLISSIEDSISQYAPKLTGSAYDGVRIKDVLQMSSGARWNEDYSDPDADIHGYSAVMSGEGSFDEFVSGMKPERDPGTLCQYNSGDTQALGMLLVGATHQSISDYMQEKLCEPLGMESPGYWLLDCEGMELAAGGVNLIARDFAKLGELYRNNGVWNGEQIVPSIWVTDSIRADAPHLEPGKVIVGGHVFPFGYGYQWWIPEGDNGEFSAIGVYNQFVYVDPSRDVVIVKLSANRAYGTSPDEATNREAETMEFLRAIAASI